MGAIFVFTILLFIILDFFLEVLPNYFRNWENNKPRTRRALRTVALLLGALIIMELIERLTIWLEKLMQ
jgi:hypothetical protein